MCNQKYEEKIDASDKRDLIISFTFSMHPVHIFRRPILWRIRFPIVEMRWKSQNHEQFIVDSLEKWDMKTNSEKFLFMIWKFRAERKCSSYMFVDREFMCWIWRSNWPSITWSEIKSPFAKSSVKKWVKGFFLPRNRYGTSNSHASFIGKASKI